MNRFAILKFKGEKVEKYNTCPLEMTFSLSLFFLKICTSDKHDSSFKEISLSWNICILLLIHKKEVERNSS